MNYYIEKKFNAVKKSERYDFLNVFYTKRYYGMNVINSYFCETFIQTVIM